VPTLNIKAHNLTRSLSLANSSSSSAHICYHEKKFTDFAQGDIISQYWSKRKKLATRRKEAANTRQSIDRNAICTHFP
jgi:hypothetical protein